ncbi:MAG: phosphoglycolate phosphatase [Rhizobacter sp.]|nr:phosphoglycolate phosphatase [Rhizobacter sp.]MBP6270461.1 phosphoglycolate phosphatase [Rhizobacter sp.]
MKRDIRAVLFDLDGTVVDSAPDLAGAANEMRRARGLAEVPYARLRAMVGSGARGLVGEAFGVGPDDELFIELRDEFLARYESRMTLQTRIFEQVESLLDALDARAVPWGIVTNKAIRYADPLTRALGLHERAAVVIGGDTTPHSKPHPAPLLEAARRMHIDPACCLYVGDDIRDVQAGQAAGMCTVAVTWGYLGVGDPVESWGAHHTVDIAMDVLNLLAT